MESSENGKNVCHRDTHLEVWVIAEGKDVLLYQVAGGTFFVACCDVPLDLHANFSDVGDGLPGKQISLREYTAAILKWKQGSLLMA